MILRIVRLKNENKYKILILFCNIRIIRNKSNVVLYEQGFNERVFIFRKNVHGSLRQLCLLRFIFVTRWLQKRSCARDFFFQRSPFIFNERAFIFRNSVQSALRQLLLLRFIVVSR